MGASGSVDRPNRFICGVLLVGKHRQDRAGNFERVENLPELLKRSETRCRGWAGDCSDNSLETRRRAVYELDSARFKSADLRAPKMLAQVASNSRQETKLERERVLFTPGREFLTRALRGLQVC